MKRREFSPRPKQPTPKELTEELLGFLGRKFYTGEGVNFAKDRSRLLAWVVLWPASWLTGKGVSVSTDRYREIFLKIMMDAVIHGTEKIKYRPAWLRMVIQSHFAVHGDEIYAEAKAVRTLAENALALAGKCATVAPPDPIRQMSAVRSILALPKPAKKQVVKEQLSLL